uniref:Plectin/eS10 N-terminal domain-containing protein n=1 Tax=Monodelphis domestica TaxID=13616 RepID=A0A5F8HG54_MONDO
MLMPLDQLRAIYELLFREGVMVAKKDLRPQSLHPEVPGGVTNLQVIRAMGSLRARGLVRETFAWRHFYWYLTNEGIAHLRQYLHLPPEIVPASLQRVRRPVAMVAPARRAPARVAREERQAYRRKEDEEAPEPPVVPASRGALLCPGKCFVNSLLSPHYFCHSPPSFLCSPHSPLASCPTPALFFPPLQCQV